MTEPYNYILLDTTLTEAEKEAIKEIFFTE